MRGVVRRSFWLVPLLALLSSGGSHAGEQTRSWRVGVGGDLPTGFLGALSIYGLPHEAILDREMTSAKELAKFQIVILSRPSYGVDKVSAAVEEYVRNGGCAIYEYPCMPSEAMIPGRRIPPQTGPDMLYEKGTAITDGLTDAVLGTGRAGRSDLTSIIPSDPRVRVLARFTDKGEHPELLRVFTDGARGAPAIIMAEYGKGKAVWSGVRLSICAAFDDNRYIAPFIANLVRELSGGEVVPRFAVQAEREDALLSEPQPYYGSFPRFVPREPTDVPPNAEVLEEDADSTEEFDLYGKVPADGEGTVYLAYHNARWYRAVRFEQRAVAIIRVDGGAEKVVRSVPRPTARGWQGLLVKRRQGGVTVCVDGRPLVSACDGPPLRGIVATRGILDAGYQAVGPVEFSDDFSRTPEEANLWETVTGTWQMVRTEGEPAEASNPFRYQGITTSAKQPAIAISGEWFWDDYCVEMSVFPDCAACGVIGHYQDVDRYVVVRLVAGANGNGTLAVTERTPRGDAKLASVAVQCERRRWYKLGLRATSGIIEGLLDGKVVVTVPDHGPGQGGVGMYVEGGKAQFDDVAVVPWRGIRRPAWGWGPWEWVVEGDGWRHDPNGGTGGALTAKLRQGGWALAPEDHFAHGRFEAQVRVEPGSEAGLILRCQGKDDFVLASLVYGPAGKLNAVMRQRAKGRDKVLESAPVSGELRGWHQVSVEAIGPGFTVSVDGRPILHRAIAALGHGAVGLYARGTAAFRDWSYMPMPSGEDVSDTPTPQYAGIIDRNSWAGRAGAWQADPTALDAFWHAGYFPHDVEVRLGVYRDGTRLITTRVALSPERDPGAGYLLTATHNWSRPTVKLELARMGETVAVGSAPVPPGADRYCLSLRRKGGLIAACVNDQYGLGYHDPDPVFAPNLGFQMLGGGLVRPDDIRVVSTALRNCTFDAAPTDWFIHSGQWEVSIRWPCSPNWAWFAGVSDKEALVRTKAKIVGDQEVQFYAGAKALPTGEAMRDIIVGLCGTEDPAEGYRFTIESHSGGTFLSKNGSVVARAEGFVLSQAAIHFDWTSFAVRKQENRLSLKWWGRTILEYQDPAPLAGGYVWLGTFKNGISIPRVTIYGRGE